MLPTPALSTSPYGTSHNLPMKVLIIEDCPTTQLAMKQMLVKIGLKEDNITFSSNTEKVSGLSANVNSTLSSSTRIWDKEVLVWTC
jgi:hypothetical protein